MVPKNTKCQVLLQTMLLHAIQSTNLISIIMSTSKIPFLQLNSNHSVCYGTLTPTVDPDVDFVLGKRTPGEWHYDSYEYRTT